MALGSIQPLTEMSTRNLLGGKGRLAREADNLTAICELTVYKCRSLDVSQPYRPSWPVTGIALPFLRNPNLSWVTGYPGLPSNETMVDTDYFVDYKVHSTHADSDRHKLLLLPHQTRDGKLEKTVQMK
jgi:hypothetical protein